MINNPIAADPTIYPGLFISGSGISINTYVTTTSASTYSRTGSYFWYGTDKAFVYGSSTSDANIHVGNLYQNISPLSGDIGTVTSVSSAIMPQVVVTYANSSSTLNASANMQIVVPSTDATKLSTIWSGGSNRVYVDGNPLYSAFPSTSTSYVYISTISGSTITLAKTSGTFALTNITTGSSLTCNNLLMFSDTAPGSVVTIDNVKNNTVNYFYGGDSLSIGWYRIKYIMGGDENHSAQPRSLNEVITPGPILATSTFVNTGSFYTTDYVFNSQINNIAPGTQAGLEAEWREKYVDIYHGGGTLGIYFYDPGSYSDNTSGAPNPVYVIGRPPTASISSQFSSSTVGYSTSSVNMFISQNIVISSATTATVTSSVITISTQVITLTNTVSAIDLTDTLKFTI
jgi:hypothetical protein